MHLRLCLNTHVHSHTLEGWGYTLSQVAGMCQGLHWVFYILHILFTVATIMKASDSNHINQCMQQIFTEHLLCARQLTCREPEVVGSITSPVIAHS